MTYLVIGSGGKAKHGFLQSLVDFGIEPWVIDMEDDISEYPSGVRVTRVSSFANNVVLQAVIDAKCDEIIGCGTIYEKTLETAAFIAEKLRLSGYSPHEIQIARDKIAMYAFLDLHEVRVAPYIKFDIDRVIAENGDEIKAFGVPCVIKPARGTANLGVRVIRSEEEITDTLIEAKADLIASPDSSFLFEGPVDQWLCCRFVGDREIEIDVLVRDGNPDYTLIHEKTIIRERGTVIEENNAVTPPISLTTSETTAINISVRKIARAIASMLMGASGMREFPLYLEYRISPKGECWCLEFAFRVGGGLVPQSIKCAYGIDLFKVAAACFLRRSIPTSEVATMAGVYWQVLYSDRKGIFMGIECPDYVEGVIVEPVRTLGHPIEIPQSDYLAYIFVQGASATKATERAADWISASSVIVQEPGGGIVKIAIPKPQCDLKFRG